MRLVWRLQKNWKKMGRLGRARIYTIGGRSIFDKDIWLQDIEWLKKHAQITISVKCSSWG